MAMESYDVSVVDEETKKDSPILVGWDLDEDKVKAFRKLNLIEEILLDMKSDYTVTGSGYGLSPLVEHSLESAISAVHCSMLVLAGELDVDSMDDDLESSVTAIQVYVKSLESKE